MWQNKALKKKKGSAGAVADETKYQQCHEFSHNLHNYSRKSQVLWKLLLVRIKNRDVLRTTDKHCKLSLWVMQCTYNGTLPGQKIGDRKHNHQIFFQILFQDQAPKVKHQRSDWNWVDAITLSLNFGTTIEDTLYLQSSFVLCHSKPSSAMNRAIFSTRWQ